MIQDLVATYRVKSKTEREKGTYFEELIRTYFRHEPRFADLYSDVWLYSDWAKQIGGPEFGFSAKDTGIDLVAKTHGTGDYHAIRCKFYAEDHQNHGQRQIYPRTLPPRHHRHPGDDEGRQWAAEAGD